MSYSNGYIIRFAAGICMFCSVFVSGSYVLLKERQDENKILDRYKNVVSVAGLIDDTATSEEIMSSFETNIRPRIVTLSSGDYNEGIDPTTFDQKAASLDPTTSREAPDNAAKILRLPTDAIIYQVIENDEISALILPIEGKGLWSTLYGFLALEKDTTTIKGLTYYQHGETPGLGGEVDNPRWKGLWPGKQAFDADWNPIIEVVKGQGRNENQVDGLSGATLTARGVTYMLDLWLGPDGFGPYLENFRENGE